MASQLVAGLTLKFTMVPSWSVVCNAPLTAAAGTLAKAANVINVKTRPNHSLGLGEEDFERVIVALFLLFANQRQVSGYAVERAWGKRLDAKVLCCDVAHTALRGRRGPLDLHFSECASETKTANACGQFPKSCNLHYNLCGHQRFVQLWEILLGAT